jgi:hypothetical protein
MGEEEGEHGESTDEATVPAGYGEIPDPPPKGKAGSDFHEPPPLPHDGIIRPMPDQGDETDVTPVNP